MTPAACHTVKNNFLTKDERRMSKKFVAVIVVSNFLTQAIALLANPSNVWILSKLAFGSIMIQWLAFVHAGGIFGNVRTEKFYDLTGSLTFTTLTISSLLFLGWQNLSLRQLVVSTCLLCWCFRLGGFLFWRICDTGLDSRFVAIKKDFYRFWSAWTIQGVWVFITALPVYILNSGPDQGPSALTARDLAGLSLWLFGFVFEVLSDHQKTQWRHNPANKGRFISSGLWAWSRHPNYFGEIVLWLGLFIASSTSFTRPGQWVALLSPVFVAFLLINVSGIPMLEKASDEKWGESAEYKAYKQRVPVLIPLIGRCGDAKF